MKKPEHRNSVKHTALGHERRVLSTVALQNVVGGEGAEAPKRPLEGDMPPKRPN